MNFSNMKQLKKILSLVLAIAMMAALFAGCKKKNNDTPETSSEPGLILPTETTEPETEPTETEPPVINKKMATVLSPLYIRRLPQQ